MIDRKTYPITYKELQAYLASLLEREAKRIKENKICGDSAVEYLLEIRERLWQYEKLQH